MGGMSAMRSVLLAISENRWMRERGPQLWFVRRAARKFMPGESPDDMLRAAADLRPLGIDAVFTRLGENVTDAAEASAVTRHYLDVLDAVAAQGIRCEPSIKLTQLGLDLGTEPAFANLRALAERSHATGNYLWIDMEQSSYVDVTLDLTRRVHAEFPRVGVCLQAYLYRTPGDLQALVDAGIGVRLVKGAYKEPPEVAYPKKADVDEHFFTLSAAMLEGLGRHNGFRPVFGTHDAHLITRIRAHAERAGLAARDVEVHMLYGIQRGEQDRLVKEGAVVRVLIAYGSYWFPWYMRRLAERPANVWFVLRSMFAG
jgi:proline dehydrogenase